MLEAGGQALAFQAERSHQLLACLALHSGDWVTRDRLAALFWPERSNAEARRNLRKVIFRARAVQGAASVEATEHALRWHVATDLQMLQSALGEGRHRDAAQLCIGPLLAGIDDPGNAALAEWLAAERSRVATLSHQAVLAHLKSLTDPQARSELATQLLRDDALDESALAELLRAESELGHFTQAQRAYRAYAHQLADELGVEPSRALREMVDHKPADPLAPDRPEAQADFVGRRIELAELLALLARPDCRLLTLLGPGGIGKSRLAREALLRCGRDFPGGTLWVELQDLVDLASVIARLAQRLKVDINDMQDPVQQLLKGLPAGRVLIVLDNAEHLAELPALLTRLLGSDRPLCLLATSRARLQAGGEWLHPLAGLAVPDEQSHDLEAAGSYDAVRLFDLRASAAQRSFELARHLPAVIRILDAVAGMPLAIELAAGWVRLLPPEEIARDLQDSIDVLQHDPAAAQAPARPEHRSVRAVLERSWSLLVPREREALAALSVFEGGFTRAAAQAVADAALPLLASLADKSLLSTDAAGRFAMHPVVAAYAAEQLGHDAARARELQRRHAQHFARFLEALEPHARKDQRVLVEQLSAEFANCRSAWQRALALERADLVSAMVFTLMTFYENRGRLVEGIAQLRPGLALRDTDTTSAQALSRLRRALSGLLYRKGELQEARAMAETALIPAERCGARDSLKGCLGTIGLCLWHEGSFDQAAARFERALQLSQEDGDRFGVALALSHLAIAHKALGRYDQALQLNLEALALERELGNQRGVAAKFNNIGNLHRAKGEWAAAQPYFEEGLAHCKRYELAASAAMLQLNLGFTQLELGLHASARRHLEAVLADIYGSSQLQITIAAEFGLARIAIAERDAGRALAGLRRAAQLTRANSFKANLVMVATIYAELLAAFGQPLQAARIWTMTAAYPGVDDADRQGTLKLLRGLALSPEAQAEAASAAPSLDEVLAQLDAPHAAMDTAPT